MKRLSLGGICLALLLQGCGLNIPFFTKEPEMIAVPLQDARNLYAKVRVLYVTRYERDIGKCTRSELTAGECQELARVHEQAVRADFLIRAKLDSPTSELDTDNLMLLLNLAAGLRP